MVAGTRVVTIGVYDWDLDSWLAALRRADVVAVYDVRQRRGVRGPLYTWANARRLQGVLAAAGIAYEHHPELAPTTELRHVQYAEDESKGVGKRSRAVLADEYRDRYLAEILDRVDVPAVVETMPADGATALLCVEQVPQACHRSLVAARMAEECGVAVTHLVPEEGSALHT
jgi:hypothetical protein